MNKTSYRDRGAIGALLDEYERALIDLKRIVSTVSTKELITIVDANTKDPDCRSVQSILTHVVCSGNNYIVIIRKWLGEELEYFEKITLHQRKNYIDALDQLLVRTEKFFDDYPDIQLVCKDGSHRINVHWGQTFDVDQLMEHAIVHILRHRRQIERFLLKMRNT